MIGDRIKELRTLNSITQEELGKKIGVVKQTISSWENNISTPNYDLLKEIAILFDKSTDYLLEMHETKKNNLNTNFSNEELKLVYIFRTLNDDNKIRATARLLDLQQEQQSFTQDRQEQSSNFQKTKKANKIS